MTNFEKIKAMSVEEMAEFLAIRHFEALNRLLKDIGQEPMNECFLGLAIRGKRIWLLEDVDENMFPEICSCGYRFENDETICPNCGKKVEEDG